MSERTWPENAKPTPEQLADWIVAIPREERIERAEVILDAMDRADACFLHNHAGLLDRLEAAEAKVAKTITISPIEWAECIREAQSRAWLEGHAAGRDYQGDGWNSDVHDPAEDNPYSAPQPADAPEGHGDAGEAGEGDVCAHEWVAAPRRLNEPATREVCVKCGETREVEA